MELVIAGQHREGANALLARYAEAPGLILVSAAHGLVEAMNALRGLVRGSHMTADDGLEAAEWLGALELVLDSTTPRLRRIWSLREAMSAYDAAYAAAAEAFGAPLITADRRLWRACDAAGIPAALLNQLADANRQRSRGA